MQPAQLSWGSGVVDFVMNRREFTPRGVILGVNPRGLADRTVPVLRVDGADGKLRAVLFGAAVHGTTLGPDNYQLCGDYAGFAQAAIQERYPGVQAMFMIGCAGDANPYPRGTMELTKKHGKTLADEVCRVLDGKFRPVRGPLQIAFSRADLPLAALSRAQVEKLAANKRGAQAFAAGQMLAVLERGEKPADALHVPVHRLAVWPRFDAWSACLGKSSWIMSPFWKRRWARTSFGSPPIAMTCSAICRPLECWAKGATRHADSTRATPASSTPGRKPL